ncbi:MAG: AMMECR1 domain-containing protein [Gammaproteobacteria bacterium RIFCSPHIGHO2_02_FULL_42_13]|nr:MAG: AMMECR1 domain-containing protein [Gammaproteobacteria bacterium RIFCSPHIGHO2_02_FULL_42_13]
MSDYSVDDQQTLLKTARDVIQYTLDQDGQMPVDPEEYSENLRTVRASFVTLELNGQLRGCIGTLVAYQPLIKDVAHNAYAAAFADPRFSQVTDEEVSQLSIHISVLSVPEPMSFSSEADLLQQLRPGVDGLILTDGVHRSTFLPIVWEQIPDPAQFLAHLKAKAGLASNYWSDSIRFERYTAELIGT